MVYSSTREGSSIGVDPVSIALIVSAVVSATASTVSGINQYNTAKAGVESTRLQERENNKKAARNIEVTEKKRVDALRDQSLKQKQETGTLLSQQGALGLAMNSGTLLEQQLGNELVQQMDTVRLNDRYDDSIMGEWNSLNSANDALALQRDQLQGQKTSAIWSTVGAVAGSVTQGLGAVGGAGASGPDATQASKTSTQVKSFDTPSYGGQTTTGAGTWQQPKYDISPSVFNQ